MMIYLVIARITAKLLNLFGAFFLTLTLTFFLMKLIPGDPFTSPQGVPQEIIDAMHKHYGFNDPLYVQYGRYLKGVLKGDLGPSFKHKERAVVDIIKSHFPVSARLGAQALIVSLVLGLSLGIFAAKRRRLEGPFMFFASLCISMPGFIVAALLQFVFGIKLGWLPIARWGTFAQTVLPTIALSALPTAFIARLVRSNLLETMQESYAMTARAKGLSETQVLLRHLLPNSLLSVIAFLGFYILSILSGSFTIEQVFGIPGTGQAMIIAITNRDYTVIMGLTIFYSAIFLLAVFLADMLSMMIDPRLRSKPKRRRHA